jgi:hypothetical protein
VNRETTPMVMRLITPVRDHLDKPVQSFSSKNAGWKQEGLVFIVFVQRNTPSGSVQDTHTIPLTNVAGISIYNIDVAKLAEENARRQEAAKQVLETPDPEDLQ